MFKNEDYDIRLHERDSSQIVVVFTSAGHNGVGEPFEEFRKSLKAFDVSMMFVIDRRCQWYSYRSTIEVFEMISDTCARFSKVAVLGESMGGSGAILFSNYCKNLDRVLSVSPQFSMQFPFIGFDDRFKGYAELIPFKLVKNFGYSVNMCKCTILYGDFDWREFIHASMFQAFGFETCFVEGADHGVAWWLKSHPAGNLLSSLLSSFLDFNTPFDCGVIGRVLGELITQKAMGRATLNYLAQPPRSIMISAGKPATQSSSGPDTRGTANEDASRATLGLHEHQAFSTDTEYDPWWRVDLEALHVIDQIRLYNKMGWEFAPRARHLVLEASIDDLNWSEVFAKRNDEVFFGYDGRPFIWNCNGTLVTRYIRVRLIGITCLHLAQVEVFGRRCPAREGLQIPGRLRCSQAPG